MTQPCSQLARALVVLLGMALYVAPAAAQVNVDIDLGGSENAVAVEGSIDASVGTPAPAVAADGGANATATLDQNLALEAVKSRLALPLERILTLARIETDGEIVDAQLVSAEGFLLYQLTVVEPDGDVTELYFYARSGERVQTN